MAGIVYFVQDSTFNFTKIGHTKGPIKDVLEKLQFGNPITLTVYKTIKMCFTLSIGANRTSSSQFICCISYS
jgi:hypothetical protein